MHFNELVQSISGIHESFSSKANKAINMYVTLRNWIIGAYIQKYEQKGADRAEYGAKLLENLAAQLKKQKIPGCSERNLQLFRRFYRTYPSISHPLSAEFK